MDERTMIQNSDMPLGPGTRNPAASVIIGKEPVELEEGRTGGPRPYALCPCL